METPFAVASLAIGLGVYLGSRYRKDIGVRSTEKVSVEDLLSRIDNSRVDDEEDEYQPPQTITMQASLISPFHHYTTIPSPTIRTTPKPNSLSVRATTEPTQPDPTDPSPKLNKFSSRITEPILYGVGLSDDDLKKPQIGISSVWYEGNTCNMHLLKLSEAVKDGVKEAGMIGFRFNTIGVSDAISMGTSLQSRDLIADSIETVMSAQWYDGNISIPSCDKNVSFLSQFLGTI